jgi:hypothetical protein
MTPVLAVTVPHPVMVGLAADNRPALVSQSLAPSHSSVVGRLKERWLAWAEIGTTDLVLGWIKNGVTLTPKTEISLSPSRVCRTSREWKDIH